MARWKEYVEFIPKAETPAEIPGEIAVEYYICWPDEPKEITPDSCRKILKNLRDGQWSSIYLTNGPEYLDSDEETNIECSDGQSVLLQKYTTADKDSVMTAIEYFIRTGKLWNGIQWMKSWRELDKEDK